MTLDTFIKGNRNKIDKHITNIFGSDWCKSDHERRILILNTKDLYKWVQSKGINLDQQEIPHVYVNLAAKEAVDGKMCILRKDSMRG